MGVESIQMGGELVSVATVVVLVEVPCFFEKATFVFGMGSYVLFLRI